ncbi:response regulator [Pseudoxanthomonas gei]|uniref:Response regulator n=1 Tax=Pseudoxanthomonas gei TaxID=1383030 RepID=A0ABX0ADH1_9GAMM|nr:response regulator [Pseudoxanthomonas gei]NDK38560.1 response regulator [Pseudoxanthomonas gei]
MAESIKGKHILLVEDDQLVAFTVEDMLLYAEAGTVTVAETVAKALEALASQQFDAAIVDVNLRGEASWPVATELRSQGVPYLTATGYGEMVQHDLAGTLLSKPYSMNQLLTALSTLFEPQAIQPDQARQA